MRGLGLGGGLGSGHSGDPPVGSTGEENESVSQ